MLKKHLKYFLSLIILMHCVGITQLVSAYSKDSSTYVGMLSMNEEETKKEKESKQDTDDSKDLKQKLFIQSPYYHFTDKQACFITSKNRIKHQFCSDTPTPPPDLQR